MDAQLRQAQRSNDPVAWLRIKMRMGEVSESIKKILCALGYEPMVLALGLPGRTSEKQISFMKPKTFCNYKDGYWLHGIDASRVARFLYKKFWSRTLSDEVLKKSVIDVRKFSHQEQALDYQTLVNEISEQGFQGAITGRTRDDGFFELLDGHARMRAVRAAQYRLPKHLALAYKLGTEEVRDAMTTAVLQRLG